MNIIVKKSHKFSKKTRVAKDIKFVIIHYTGMQSTRDSLKRLLSKKTDVSCHYLIDRKGLIYKMIEESKVAWHAGQSKWKNFNKLNDKSIGIELQNKGHLINYENFPKPQIEALIRLLKKLKKKYQIKNHNILGHSEISPLRKIDPGEKFPWQILNKKGVSTWFPKFNVNKYTLDKNKVRKIFFKNLYKIGYRYFNLSKKTSKDTRIIKVFQMRYLPSSVSGKITNKTLQISQLLVKKSDFT